ncbi:hypothetical protein, partial [Noviherbaspirillum denitrificans]|uniref:hypothetical protein n=1 Tax=Noviherbaspirillum denitrificans TaxID=1968433 RepID=UPI001981834F
MNGAMRRAVVAPAPAPADRDQWPITYVSDPDGARQVLCRYGDMVWDLTPLMPNSNATPGMRRLRFDRLPPVWRESAKALLYAYWVHGRPGWKAPGASTLAGVFRRLQRL